MSDTLSGHSRRSELDATCAEDISDGESELGRLLDEPITTVRSLEIHPLVDEARLSERVALGCESRDRCPIAIQLRRIIVVLRVIAISSAPHLALRIV